MTAKPTNENHDQVLFANLIMMLAASSMQQMGKTLNPLTNKTEVDLQTAQMTIDMIAMLQAKTQGNCDAAEEKMLRDLLASLRMNYVETVEQEEKRKKENAATGKNQQEEKADDAKDKKDGNGPKYHKAYDS